jgi:hypothetical protein
MKNGLSMRTNALARWFIVGDTNSPWGIVARGRGFLPSGKPFFRFEETDR